MIPILLATHIQCTVIRCQSHLCLLCSIRSANTRKQSNTKRYSEIIQLTNLLVSLISECALSLSLPLLPDKSVHFLGLDIIHLLDSILDLFLGGSYIYNEHKYIVVFDLLHCRLSGERELED